MYRHYLTWRYFDLIEEEQLVMRELHLDAEQMITLITQLLVLGENGTHNNNLVVRI